MMLIRNRLIVEHNMQSLIESWENGNWATKEIDLKMQFVDFICEFTDEEIKHGISYLSQNSPELYEVMFPIIVDYQTYGMLHFEEPDPDDFYEDKPKTWFDKVKEVFQNVMVKR